MNDLKHSYADYSFSNGVLCRLTDDWNKITLRSDNNRRLRYIRDIDGQKLRDNGLIKADETYIPIRVIDTNIRREQPQYIEYLTKSRRSLVFGTTSDKTSVDVSQLDTIFAKKARYLGWEKPFIRVIDGTQTHGWDSVEVVLDLDSPGNFSIEHVGHNNLIFDLESENIAAQEIIARRLNLTTFQLQEQVKKNGFNEDEISRLLETNTKTPDKRNEAIFSVYKIFYKESGLVFVAWWCKTAQTWLKTPTPLYLGIHNVLTAQIPNEAGISDYPVEYETEYPIYLLPYVESEDPKIIELVGRAFLDESAQEAASAMQSGLVNGVVRAANIYASPKALPTNANPAASPKETNVVLKNGAIYDQPLEFFHTPYPDISVATAIQQTLTINQQETSQVNYAVLNRKDSEKTATEITAAQTESQKLSSVKVTLLSIFIISVYSKAWKIFQNRVLQGKIPIAAENLPLFGDVDSQTGQVVAVNIYTLKASGDIDVIQKAEKIQKQMQFWPVINKTALANDFLKDIIKTAFPEDADRYNMILDQAKLQGDQQKISLIAKLAGLVKELAIDNTTNQIRPELSGMESQLIQLNNEVNAAIGTPPKE